MTVLQGGTGVTTSTGTGNNVLSTSPTLVTPVLGTPTSATLTNATGLPIATGVSGLGTGVATSLAVNVGSSGAPLVNGGVLGTPSSGTVTNLTGTASININGTVGATTANTGAFTTLSATGVTTVQAGTVSLPAITTSGDTNTGIFFPAADTIAFTEGGTESMRIDSAGQVGIGGTASAGENLSVIKNITGSTVGVGIFSGGVVQSDVTNQTRFFNTFARTAVSSFTLSNMWHYTATQGTLGAGSAVTNQSGFYADSSLIGATNNYGFFGNIASGTGRYNLFMNGTAANYMAGSLGIGGIGNADTKINIGGTLPSSSANSKGVFAQYTIPSTSTSQTVSYLSYPSTQATAFTAGQIIHFYALQGAIGAGSAVTNQYGFYFDSTSTGATNNYGFYGDMASGTNRFNLYMNGTANNYLAGSLGIGVVPTATVALQVQKSLTGGINAYNVYSSPTNAADVTNSMSGYLAVPSTANAISTVYGYWASQGTFTGAVTNHMGFHAGSALTGATNNYGFYGNIASGTGRYNLYMAGTADNYFAGSVGIGATANASALLDVQSTTKGVRMPNMTTTQKNAISSPAAGLIVFDTTLAKLCVYSGSAWQTITSV